MTTPPTPLTPLDNAWDRRKFIKHAGFAVLAVQCLPATAYASQHSVDDLTRPNADLTIKSGPGAFHHFHYLRIPNEMLTAPPARGAELTTTKAVLHRHRLRLSQGELRSVRDGGTVTQHASSHVFVISLAKRTAEPDGAKEL